jgi:hypothetical protein
MCVCSRGSSTICPTPLPALKLVADRTKEMLILDTAAAKDEKDGALQLIWEGRVNPMSGVHNLAWRPTGPDVLETILSWLGFEETRLIFWRRPKQPKLSRIRMVGARAAHMLDGFDERLRSG